MLRSSLIISLMLTSSITEAAPRDRLEMPSVDLHGGDYDVRQNLSLAECRRVCDVDASCDAFTYNRKSSWCFLKQGPWQEQDNSQAYSEIIWRGSIVGTASFAGNYAFEGAWSEDADSCQYLDLPEHELQPTRITNSVIEGYEWECSIFRIEQLPVGPAWLLDLYCSAEGEAWQDQTLLLLSEQEQLIMLSAGRVPVEMRKCTR
jgi:hypothetical protein